MVPHPNKKPIPTVDAMAAREPGAVGYDGINDGANKYTGATLDTRPAMMGIFSELGLMMLPDSNDEIPKTAPL